MKVYISRDIPQAGIQLLEENGLTTVVNKSNKKLSIAELTSACQQADLFLNVGPGALDNDFFEACRHLKGIALASVGYDHVDLDAATSHGIPVSNTPDVLSGATADTAFLLMLAVSRRAFARAREITEGKWNDFGFNQELGIELNGKTLGILGMGRIGVEMARKARGAYGMKVIYHNRSHNQRAEQELNAAYVGFDDLLAQSDVISVHANLSDETRHKFDREAFRKMKPNAIFVNTARGKIHHEPDLIEALQQGEIWGAGLDVTDPEPMLPNNPLLAMSNVCVFPHIGSATVETRTAMVCMAAKNLLASSRGDRMPQVVNTAVYQRK